MRLWHQDLIPKLDRQRLLSQHRECCALRGNGWGRKHSVVDYIFTHNPIKLFQYHLLVMDEMKNRGYKINNAEWFDPKYRGKNCEPYKEIIDIELTTPIYTEHDDKYLNECILNLLNKGVIL